MQTKMRIQNLPGKSNPTTVFEVSGRGTKERGKNHMKTPRATKLLALFLAFVFSLYLVPTEVLAAEVGSQSAVQAEIDTETAAEENPEIVTELAEGRGRFQKEYLLSNGQRMLAVYPTAVHYEEDGEWKEIDNTLRREQRGNEDVYRNTAGAWDVTLPASLDGGSV